MDSPIPSALSWPPPRLAVAGSASPRAVSVIGRLISVLPFVLEIIRNLWPAYLLASILILYGIGWGLPDNPYQNLSFHADENAIVGGIRGMQFPTLYPGFFAWGTALFYQVWAIQGVLSLHHLLQLPGDAIYLMGRATVYVYALGTITLIFGLGRKLIGTATGRMAATTLAVLPGFVQSSHYFKTDVPTTFWLVAAVLAAYQTLTSRRALYVAFMGLLIGYAVSMKYTSIVVFPVGLVAIWMSRSLAVSFPRAVLLYAAAVIVGFLVGTPYAVVRPDLIVNAGVDHADLTVPLLPLVALFIAYLGNCLSRGKLSRVLASIGGIAVVGYAFLFSLSYVQVMAEVDPRVQASQWIDTNIPKSEPVLVEDTSPTDSPRFDTFGYASVPVDFRAAILRKASSSAYLLVSEYATRPFGKAATSATDAEQQEFWNFVATDFVEVAQFENSQKLLWLDSKNDLSSITHDWLQPNPRITIYRRVGR